MHLVAAELAFQPLQPVEFASISATSSGENTSGTKK